MQTYRNRIYENYATAFTGAGPTFDPRAADRWSRPYRHYLRRWLPAAPDAAILEVACGAGLLLHFLKNQNYSNLTALDLSPEQVRLARQVIPDVHHADALEFLEQHHDRYDLILALDFIEHLTKDEAFRFLEAAFAALKPAGRLILQTPNADSPAGPAVFFGDLTHELCFTPRGLARLLGLCRFTNLELRETGPVIHGLPSLLRFLTWQTCRLSLKLRTLAETGSPAPAIFTRTFLASAQKP